MPLGLRSGDPRTKPPAGALPDPTHPWYPDRLALVFLEGAGIPRDLGPRRLTITPSEGGWGAGRRWGGPIRAHTVVANYVAIADAAGNDVQRHQWFGDRHRNKVASAAAALTLLVERLEK